MERLSQKSLSKSIHQAPSYHEFSECISIGIKCLIWAHTTIPSQNPVSMLTLTSMNVVQGPHLLTQWDLMGHNYQYHASSSQLTKNMYLCCEVLSVLKPSDSISPLYFPNNFQKIMKMISYFYESGLTPEPYLSEKKSCFCWRLHSNHCLDRQVHYFLCHL